jgi:hypothetical protein
VFEVDLAFTVTMSVESKVEADELVLSIVATIARSGRLVKANVRDDYCPPTGDSYLLESPLRYAKRIEATMEVREIDDVKPLMAGLLKGFVTEKDVELSGFVLARARKKGRVSKGGLADDVASKGGSS